MASRASGPPIDFTGRRRRRRRRTFRTVALALVALGAVLAFYLVTHKGQLPGPLGSKPARPSFAFRFSSIKGYQLGEHRPSSATTKKAAEAIQDSLSEFYVDAFLDPETWTKGVPSDAWKVFAPAARKQALRHTSTFTLGTVGRSVASLSVTRSSLAVRVLFGPTGRAEAASAVVVFQARGKTKSGQALELRNRGGLVFRPSSGEWVIVGYPKIRTSIESVSGRSSASPSP
jgi:hypothetical protein